MKPGVPWSVKGIEPKAREAAKDAARKAGMTLGEWLNHQIMVAGSQVGEAAADSAKTGTATKTKRPATKASGTRAGAAGRAKPEARKTAKTTSKKAAKSAGASDDDFSARMNELTRRIGALGNDTSGETPKAAAAATRGTSKSSRKSASKAVTAAPERAEFSRINDRLDQTDAAMAGLKDGLDQISGRLAEMPTAAETSSVTALESALENVVEHIELTDQRNSDVLKTIQARLSDLADRGTDSIDDVFEEQRLAIRRLEDRLGGLADRIDSAERRDDSDSFRHIEDKLADLGQNVDQMRSAARNQPSIESLENRFGQIASKLAMNERTMAPQSAVNSLKSDMDQLKSELSRRNEPTKPALVQALESRLNTMSGDIESLRSNTASNSALATLDSRLDDIVRRLAHSETSRDDDSDLTELENRVAELARRLDESFNAPSAHPEFLALERKVEDFASRVDAGSPGDGGALQDLEDRVTTLTERLDRAERHFEALPGIETSLSQLFDSLETSRDAAIQAAEQAAHNAAQKISSEGGGVGPDRVAASDALSALERGLAEVKSQTAQTDKHNQETLEAVHDTLKRVVDRLGVLEEKSTSEPVLPAGSQNAEGVGLDDFRLPPLPDLAIPAAATGSETEAPADPAPAPKLEVPDPAPREPAPDSPGSARQNPAAAADAEDGDNPDFAKAYEGSLSPGSDDNAGGLTRNKDFIAAARRAAQAASQGAAPKGAAPQDEAPDTGDGPPRGGLKKGRRRSLLFAAAALFIVAGALSVSGLVGNRGAPVAQKPVSATAVPETTESLPAEDEISAPLAAPRQMSLILDNPEPRSPVAQGQLALPRTTTLTKSIGAPAGDDPAGGSSTTTPAFAPTSSVTGDVETSAASGQSVMAPSAAKTTGSAGGEIPVLTPEEEALFATDGAPAGGTPAPTIQSLAAAGTPAGAPSAPPKAELGIDEAALGGDVSAQFALATRAAEQDDPTVAAQWYQKAAAKGLAPAQYRLGALYEKGKGVAKDLGAAKIWYQRAAEQGNAKAMHNLAVLLAGGAGGGRPDYAQAARWFQKAAQLGLADSQYNLAVLHERGLGVEKDPVAAYSWFAVAAATGDSEAEKRMDDLAGKMADGDLTSARARYDAWRPAPIDPIANEVDISAWQGSVSAKARTASTDGLTLRAQRLLSNLGYDPGPADGLMGPRTRDALAAFARERGLDDSGQVTSELVQHLEAATSG